MILLSGFGALVVSEAREVERSRDRLNADALWRAACPKYRVSGPNGGQVYSSRSLDDALAFAKRHAARSLAGVAYISRDLKPLARVEQVR